MNFDTMDDDSGIEVTKKRLAEIFGLTRFGIEAMIARGAPVASVGASKQEGYRINTADWFAWMVNDAKASLDPYTIAKTDSMRHTADAKEAHNAELKAITITKAQALKLHRENADIIRTALAPVPARVVAAIAASDIRDAVSCEAIIADEINKGMAAICDASEGSDDAPE